MLVSDIVRRNARFFGANDAVVVPGGLSRTWSELDRRTDRLAHAFASLGLAPGDRVAIFAPNCPEYLDFFFGCAKSGVVGAAVNVRLGAEAIASYVRYVEPAALLVHADLVHQARAWLDDVEATVVIGLGGEHPFDHDLEQLIAAEGDGPPPTLVSDDDVYQLAATSGTTGIPKGAMMTHRNAVSAMVNWLAEMPVPECGTALQCIPYFFNPGGPAGLHPVMMKGGRVVVPPTFAPDAFADLVERYGVTHTVVVPTMLQMVLETSAAADRDLSSLQGVNTGGSPLSAALLRLGRDVIGDVFYPLYGMAETYSCAMVLRPEDQFTEGTEQQRRQLSSLGKPMVLTRARVVDESGVEAEADGQSPGEILLAGDTTSAGYFRMPEETAHSRVGDWFRSGDVGVVDEERFVTIVDRLKDIIITGGINVFSIEVEQALETHADVERAAVIGVAHAQWGEAIHAVVVRTPGGTVTEDELARYVGARLGAYKKPRSVDFVDSLPLSGTGKVLKRVLRERDTPAPALASNLPIAHTTEER